MKNMVGVVRVSGYEKEKKKKEKKEKKKKEKKLSLKEEKRELLKLRKRHNRSLMPKMRMPKISHLWKCPKLKSQ